MIPAKEGQPTNERIITTAEDFLKEQVVRVPHWNLQPGDPTTGRQTPRIFGFESQWSLFSGEPEDSEK